MQRILTQIGVILSGWLLMSCAIVSGSAPPDDIKSVDSAFVYGYVEAERDVIEQVDFVEFGKVYIPPLRKPPRVLVFDNGMFMAENIKPGKYVIAGFRSDRNHYNMVSSRRQAYQRVFRIEPGEMEFIGSFNVRPIHGDKMRTEDFDVIQIQRPGERDVLKHLYHVTEGTAWQDKIAVRLKQLRQY
ncbi:MAG: hypothetical protein PVG75_00525 [Thioalkalispiraceae bacterium]